MENRLLSDQDVPCIAHLLQEGFPASGWSAHDLNQFIRLETCLSWGVFQNEKLSGFLLIQGVEDEAEVLLLVVHPLCRNQGIASSLLQAAQNDLQPKNIHRLFLEVSVENKTAISFYQKMKFEIVGDRKNYYSRKHNKSAYIMLKNIK